MSIANAAPRCLRMMRRSSAISTSIRTLNNVTRRFHSIEWGAVEVQGGGIRSDRIVSSVRNRSIPAGVPFRGNSRREGSVPMQYVHLGRSGVKVSRLCLGTMNFGPETSEGDGFAIMDRALELGLNFFDTADVYGWKVGEGWTEQIVGRWFAQGGGRREKTVLATKVYGRMSDWPNFSRLSALNIRQAVEGSLKRLQTDYIDLYQMHHIDRNTPWDEIWQAMETLVKQGKILYVGSSNFAGWHIAKANEIAKSRHFLGLVSEQCLYNLKARTAEMDVIPAS